MGSAYRAVLALALAGSCAAYAQSENTTPSAAEEIELPPVTVSAHEGASVPYNQTGVSVTVLDVEELKKEGIYSLSEALTTVPGVYVQPGGGSNQQGNTSDLVIRGMSAQKYVMPMMDGMRLSSGMTDNGVIANNIVGHTPLFGMGTLELVRGAEGAVYGSGAMAGVLYMGTPEGKGDPSLTLFNEYGSYDSYTGNVVVQGKVDKTSFYLSGAYERTNNDVRYADGSRPDIKHAGKAENRTNALRLDQELSRRSKLTLTYRRQDADYRRYTPAGMWSPYSSLELFEFRSNLATVKLHSKVSEKYSTSLMAGYYGERNRLGEGYINHMHNVQLEWRNAWKWDDVHSSTAGIAWYRTQLDTVSSGQKAANNCAMDSTLSLFAEHTVEPVKDWKSTLALRLDRSNVYDALFTLRASTNYKFNHDHTRVFASAGRGYASPSSFQRGSTEYVSPWGVYHGNPSLQCETNWSVDLGAEQELAKDHFLSATLFWIRTEDGISLRSDYSSYPAQYSYCNDSGHWTNQGVELALRGVFEKTWNTGYKVAFTYAQPKNNRDEQIPNSARQVWTADLHTSPVKGLTTGLGLSAAVGRTSFDGRGIDHYIVLRWYAQYEVTENLSVHVRVENLTNQKFETESSYGYNSPAESMINPGVAVYAGCTLKF